MSFAKRTLEQHLAADGRPKRILALDGGGLRGILTLAVLERIESELRKRHDAPDDFRLSDYFDLIAGTSTGAIIAAALALGWKTSDLKEKYFELGHKVFHRGLLREGFFRAKYDEGELKQQLREVYGDKTTLGSDKLLTGLLIITKRHDSGSCWPISNNSRGMYFGHRSTENSHTIANSDYLLWQVVRASTAAPCYFEPEAIEIGTNNGVALQGDFVDGGMSPFNNPALMAVMYATLDGYHLNWPTGADRLLVASVGTGRADKTVKKSILAATHAVKGLAALMDDCAAMQEVMLQWMSNSRTARVIDREMGNLQHDLIAPTPLINYVRYNGDLDVAAVRGMLTDVSHKTAESLTEMDAPENMTMLYEIGKRTADRDVRADDFPAKFDLTAV